MSDCLTLGADGRLGGVPAGGGAPSLSAAPRGDGRAVDASLPLRRPVREWYDAAAPGVFRFVVVRAGGDSPLVDDLMQQLWIAAAKSADVLPRDEAEVWLRTVAKRLLITHWRRAGVRRACTLDEPGLAAEAAAALCGDPARPETHEALARSECRDQLGAALTELPSEDQHLLREHYVRGVPQAALGAGLGISERAVEGRLYRARRALIAALERMGHAPAARWEGGPQGPANA